MPGRRKKHYQKSFRNAAKEGATSFDLIQRESMHDEDSMAWEDRLDEQHKYGIYFADDYDYLQHLKEVKDFHEVEVKERPAFMMKEDEEDDVDDAASVSMASIAASHLPSSDDLGAVAERDLGFLVMDAESQVPPEDVDPDIAAALDDKFDFDDPDNALEDDFMMMANAEEDEDEEENWDNQEKDDEEHLSGEEEEKFSDEEEWETDEGTDSAEEDDEGEMHSGRSDDKMRSLAEWIEKTRLENADLESTASEEGSGTQRHPTDSLYSAGMLPRNENLQLLDQVTEALIAREYSWDKMGALDGEILDGKVTTESELFKQCQEDFWKSQQHMTLKEFYNKNRPEERPVIPERLKYVEEKDYSVEEEIDYSLEPLAVKKKPKYDAVSILSTYSRGKNMPTKVTLPEEWRTEKKKKKKNVSTDEGDEASTYESASVASSQPGLSLRDLDRQSRLERLADAPPTFRPKDETIEEKRNRKKAVKAQQKERRAEKKMNKMAFQDELNRQKKVQEAGKAQKNTIDLG